MNNQELEKNLIAFLSIRNATVPELVKHFRLSEPKIRIRLGKMFSRGLVRTEYDYKALKTRGSSAIWKAV